jgi:formiminotetrahydrofolate cyclodeaminase
MRDQSIEQWLNALASRSPTPGGGAAAALAAAAAAALVSMVAVYTTGERWLDRSDEMTSIDEEATKLRLQAIELADIDAKAFARVGDAYAMPKSDPTETAVRDKAIQAALKEASEPPRQVGVTASRIVELTETLIDLGNPNVISDVAVASSLAEAALEAAIVNIQINQSLIKDTDVRAELTKTIEVLRTSASCARAVTVQVGDKLGRP